MTALCWVCTAVFGFFLLMNPMDKTEGWLGLVLFLFLTLAIVSTGVLMLMYRKTHPRFGQAGVLLLVVIFLGFYDAYLALFILLIGACFGLWRLIQWFREKPQGRGGDPSPSDSQTP